MQLMPVTTEKTTGRSKLQSAPQGPGSSSRVQPLRQPSPPHCQGYGIDWFDKTSLWLQVGSLYLCLHTVHLLRPSQYFLHSQKKLRHFSIHAEAPGHGLWQEVENLCGFEGHEVLCIKCNPTARPPSLQPFSYKSQNFNFPSLRTLVAVLSISQMVSVHRQKTGVFSYIICQYICRLVECFVPTSRGEHDTNSVIPSLQPCVGRYQ